MPIFWTYRLRIILQNSISNVLHQNPQGSTCAKLRGEEQTISSGTNQWIELMENGHNALLVPIQAVGDLDHEVHPWLHQRQVCICLDSQ